MKKLINDPADVVPEALRGLAAAHPELRVDHENRVVLRADAPVQGKVGLVSGGGSGHEPMHSGLVGPGMLDAACAGEVFTSPVPDQIMAATSGVDGGASARTTTFGSMTLRRSPCAAAMPANASSTTASGALMSFFTTRAPPASWGMVRAAPAPR